MTTLVELCAGTASLSLWALGRVDPLVGFMGSKRRDRSMLMHVLDVDRPDRVHLVDAGPWGEVWAVMAHSSNSRNRVARILRSWAWWGDLAEVWPMLLFKPGDDPAERVAQYLCIQSRQAQGTAVWWDGSTWCSSDGRGKPEGAHQRGGTASGLLFFETLARRVEALDAIDWDRVTVHQCDVGDAPLVPRAREYFDPPYQGAPRYAVLLPRERVIDVARRRALAAERVVISEAEPLPLDGWASARLRPGGKPEWLTIWASSDASRQRMTDVARHHVAAKRLAQPAAQLALGLVPKACPPRARLLTSS